MKEPEGEDREDAMIRLLSVAGCWLLVISFKPENQQQVTSNR
jgi:hypothetical protein